MRRDEPRAVLCRGLRSLEDLIAGRQPPLSVNGIRATHSSLDPLHGANPKRIRHVHHSVTCRQPLPPAKARVTWKNMRPAGGARGLRALFWSTQVVVKLAAVSALWYSDHMRNALVCVMTATMSLCACTRTVYVTGQTTTVSGQATVVAAGNTSGDITLPLGPRVYSGRWVYMNGPGSVSIGTATAFSGTQSATASAVGLGMPTSGQGSIIMASPDGGHMRCVFNYSQWSVSGVGECQDETGALYDLQITR